MKNRNPQLTVIVNDANSTSEVFLQQLLHHLNSVYAIEVLSYVTPRHPEKWSFKSTGIPGPYSLQFLFQLPLLMMQYGKLNIRLLYQVFILKKVRSPRLYFPFLYMAVPLANALQLVTRHRKRFRIFTSIRGTEVTINPFVKPNVMAEYGKVLPMIEKMHFLSEKLFQQYNDLHLPSLPSYIIYQGVNRSKFPYLVSTPKDKLRFFSVGRYDYSKGFEYLLLTCHRLKLKAIPFECTIIGYGEEELKYRYMIHDLNLHKEVILKGPLNHEQLMECVAGQNLYVHTHIVTGISNTMLEAFSCGLPVLSFYSDFASYPIEGLTRYFVEVPRYDHEQLAQVLAVWNIGFRPTETEVEHILERFMLPHQVAQFERFFN